jgi:hypothetical protein
LNPKGENSKNFEDRLSELEDQPISIEAKKTRLGSFNEQIASYDYPSVGVGKPCMTATQLLHLQEINDGLPEDMQVWPGDLVSAEDTEWAIQMPEVGVPRLSGLDVVQSGLISEMDPHAAGELKKEVLWIQAAKEGKVLVFAAHIKYMPTLTREEMLAQGSPESIVDSDVIKHGVTLGDLLPPTYLLYLALSPSGYVPVPVHELTPRLADIDKVLEDQELFANGESMGPYVIPDTERVKAYLSEHGEYFG